MRCLKNLMPFLFVFIGFDGLSQAPHDAVYTSEALQIIKVAENSYVHISFLQTQDFGNVPCNGMVVHNKGEAMIFDAPTSDVAAEELIQWVRKELNASIVAVVPTHFHWDCLGSLEVFHQENITSRASDRTIALATANAYPLPQKRFKDRYVLTIGGEKVISQFFGEGHTKDNIIGYFPKDSIIFGGCLIKELNAGKGNLADANSSDWAATVEKIKKDHPNVKTVVPGHGSVGGKELLDYTISLFQ
ncbi:MAG: subclass B1 metallo-beta-lactamase [Sediminicola sp.]